jgi:hypothetical protein
VHRFTRHRPSPALVLALLAITFAVTGTGIAAVAALPPNSVGKAQLKKNAVISGKIKDGEVRSQDIANSTILTQDVRNGTLLRVDFKANQLPAGPPGPQGPQGPPGPPGVSGLQRADVSTSTDSGSPKSVSATCPAGKRTIGGGARVSGAGSSEVSITDSFPEVDGSKWNTRAVEINGTPASWVLTAFAICATVSG